MASRGLDAVFFVEKPPVVEYRDDGLFRICFDIGKDAIFEVVMSPKVFVQMRMFGGEACAKWQLGHLPDDTKVRPIKKRGH